MADVRIAVIDDDPWQVEVLTTLLEDEGYRVIAHCDVRDAAAFIKQEHPALALLDLVQGYRLVGIDVLRELRGDPQTRDLPIIIISADAPALRDNAAELSLHRVAALGKPYSIEMLASLIRESLQ